MDKIYVALIRKGKIGINDVPAQLRDAVIELLAADGDEADISRMINNSEYIAAGQILMGVDS